MKEKIEKLKFKPENKDGDGKGSAGGFFNKGKGSFGGKGDFGGGYQKGSAGTSSLYNNKGKGNFRTYGQVDKDGEEDEDGDGPLKKAKFESFNN